MKFRAIKAAAIGCAALLSVCTAQAITASASSPVVLSTVGQSMATAGFYWASFYNWNMSGGGFAPGKYWNGGNAYACTSNPNASSNSVAQGLTTAYQYSYNIPGLTSGALTGSRGFARVLANLYFQTNAYMRVYTSMNFQAHVGDQIVLYKWQNGNQVVDRAMFVYSVSSTGTVYYADCNPSDHNKIRWGRTGCFHNGGWIDDSTGTYQGVFYVERPILTGDLNGDGLVDDTDFNMERDLLGVPFIDYTGTIDARFVNAVADCNADGVVNWDDYTIVARNENGLLKNNSTKGFLVALPS